MRIQIFTLVVILILSCSLFSQVVLTHRLNEIPDRSGLVGNGITDLLWSDLNQTLYVGTGFGLSTTQNDGNTWNNFTTAEYGGKGGISAMAEADDGTLWIATAYDTLVEEGQRLSIGGGLRYIHPDSSTWHFISQPVDARDDTTNGKQPTTTRVQNLTFDIAMLDTQIWIASFGGGIRRSLDKGKTWEVITTDSKPFGAFANLNHRGFSLLAENGNIWTGTAEGISKSTDGGNSWQRFTHTNQVNPISGNFVIALAHNPYDDAIWAATIKAEDTTENTAVSKTMNGGLSWNIHLEQELSDGSFVRYFAFKDSAVYVATENGVYKTIDNGQTWFTIPSVRDSDSGESLMTDDFLSVAVSPANQPFHKTWLGSSDGLALSDDNGFSWTIFRSFVSTRVRTDPRVYPSPNPFSPTRMDPIKFRFDISEVSSTKIDIYNFAMEKVISIGPYEMIPTDGTNDRFIPWDGLDNNRRMVDNGVYFFRAQIGGEVSWGKIVIIN
jgi:photosystem II stability/assembly factor-like uncharacterized protein